MVNICTSLRNGILCDCFQNINTYNKFNENHTFRQVILSTKNFQEKNNQNIHTYLLQLQYAKFNKRVHMPKFSHTLGYWWRMIHNWSWFIFLHNTLGTHEGIPINLSSFNYNLVIEWL